MGSIEQHGTGVSSTGGNIDGATVGQEGRESERARWATKSTAELLTGAEFAVVKEQLGLHVVGVTGFSGQWAESKIAADAGIKGDVDAATAVLEAHLADLKSTYGAKLVLSSGATNEGVPKIIYDLCEKLGIDAMGVTSAKAFDYPLGKMKYLIVQGDDWGAESSTFLATSDEILLLGGGGQAKREAIAAESEGKMVTVFQGFKGSADQLTAAELPSATFVARH